MLKNTLGDRDAQDQHARAVHVVKATASCWHSQLPRLQRQLHPIRVDPRMPQVQRGLVRGRVDLQIRPVHLARLVVEVELLALRQLVRRVWSSTRARGLENYLQFRKGASC